jgi:hypothetical protein
MLKTKKRNIFDNLIGDIENKIQQDGGFSWGFKKSKKQKESTESSTNNKTKTKKRSLFSKLMDFDCEKLNKIDDENLRQRKCLKKSKTCKFTKKTAKCDFKSSDEKRKSKKKKKIEDKERKDELDERSKFKNSKLYNTNIMCYYKFISRKKYPRDSKDINLSLTHETSKITFRVPRNNDGWIRNFWHIFMSHNSWLNIFDRFEQRYTGKTEAEFGENGDKEGNLYEVYLEFGKNMNVAYRQFMEFIVEMHCGREKIDSDQALDKLFDNIINKSIGLEYYINRAKIKYVQDFKLEKSKVFNTGDVAFKLLAEKERGTAAQDKFKYNPQDETKRTQGKQIVDRTDGPEYIQQQKKFIQDEKNKARGEETKIQGILNRFQSRIDQFNEASLTEQDRTNFIAEIGNINRIVESSIAFSSEALIKMETIIKETESNINSLIQNKEGTQDIRKLIGSLESVKTEFIPVNTQLDTLEQGIKNLTSVEEYKNEMKDKETIKEYKEKIKVQLKMFNETYQNILNINTRFLTFREKFLEQFDELTKKQKEKSGKPDSSQAGGQQAPMNINYTTTGSEAQTIGDYAGEMADKVFQGKYGRDEAFAASRTPAISMLKNERPDEDFFDEAAKELSIDKSFVKTQLTPAQIAEYRIIRSKGNLKYVTPLDYFRWATEDTMRLQEDYRYAKYNIRVINKIMRSFDGFCLSNLLFKKGDNKNPTAKDISYGYAGIVVRMRRDKLTKAFKNYSFIIDKLGTEVKDEVEIIDNHNKKMGDLADINDISIENDIFRENLYRFKHALEEREGLTDTGISTEKTNICKDVKKSESNVNPNDNLNPSTGLRDSANLELESEAGGGFNKKEDEFFRNHQEGGKMKFGEGASYRFRVTKEGHFLTRDMFILPPIMFTKNRLRCGEKILGEKSSAYFGSDCQRNPIKLFTQKDIKNKNYVCKDYRNPNIKVDHLARYLAVRVSQVARKRPRKSCFRKDMMEALEKGTNKYRYWGFKSETDFYYRYDFSENKERVAVFIPEAIKNKITDNRDGVGSVSRTPVLIKSDKLKQNCNPDEGYFQLKNLNPLQEEVLIGEKGIHAYLLEAITKGDRQLMRLDYNDIIVKATKEELNSIQLQNTIRDYVGRQFQILELANQDSVSEKNNKIKQAYENILRSFGDRTNFINGIGKNIFFMEKKLKYVRLYLHKVRSTPFEKNDPGNWHELDNPDVRSNNNRLMLFMDDYFESSLFQEILDNSIKEKFITKFTEKIKDLETKIAAGDKRTKERVEQRRNRVTTTEKLRQEQVDARSKMSTISEEREREKYKDYRPGFGFGNGSNMGIDMGT